jgi:hypothetical protein
MLQQQVAKTGILDLSYRELTSCPEFVWKLCECRLAKKMRILTFFFFLASLKTLNLEHNQITEIRVPKDANCPLLETVDVSHNQIKVIEGGHVNFLFFLNLFAIRKYLRPFQSLAAPILRRWTYRSISSKIFRTSSACSFRIASFA